MLSWITRKVKPETAKEYAVHKYARNESKPDYLFCKTIHGLLGLFLNNGL